MRYTASELATFGERLLSKAGLAPSIARTVAQVLVEADLLGHTTHGLHLLAAYLAELEKGAMAKAGEPRVIADLPAAVTWDGMRLPGPWLTTKAVDLAMERARIHGTCTVIITRSHHIACLAAYLQRVAEAGLVGILACSAPDDHSVAPYGGRRGVFSPNPVAAAWPTKGEPVILDVSMSIAAIGKAKRAHEEGREFPAPWLIDAEGRPSAVPGVLFGEPRGALLPLGGCDHGHKGYALLLLVEALTSGLGGWGRADAREGWTACVYLQVLDPALFGGIGAFRQQSQWMVDACHECPPREGGDRVRVPGETGLRVRAEQLRNGVELYPGVLPALKPCCDRLGVPMPAPLPRSTP